MGNISQDLGVADWDWGDPEDHPPGWITRDAQRLKITEMETSHIKNCIRMLESQNRKIESQIRLFEAELERRNHD